MSDGPRVCYVVNAINGGSIPGEIAAAITDQTPFTVDVLAWFDADAVPGLDIHIDCLNAPNTTLGVDLESLQSLRKHLREYDLVHVHHNHSGSIAKPVAAIQGTPVVSTEHNEHRGFTRMGRLVNGLTNPLAEAVTCVSHAVFDSFARWERLLVATTPVEIVHNGIDLERIDQVIEDERIAEDIGSIQTSTDEAFVVASGGRLTEQKGYDTLVRAVAAANDELGRPVELRLTGDGPLRSEIEALASDLSIADQVQLLGFLPDREDVYRVMAAADLYAVPSRWEGFCVAVPEAMATRTPCLLSDIPVFRELYDGAAVFHPVDDPESMADRMVTLARDNDRRASLSERGRALVTSRYTLESTAQRYAQTYRVVLNRNRH